MDQKPTIRVQNISKTFKLYPTRRGRIIELMHPLRRKLHKKFHALKDINFSVEKGEVLGLIGQNGSGKSTLLKILSSVVTPTSGSFECNGRVIPLLELGGGFNLELTGVENVFFLGAIQGYTKKEMATRLQEILDFADIGDYAYQPVNSYSSGMYVRLAFSINIHIDPEILIVDEALAVGDVRFQQKCYRRIREFKDSGKTIVFCTHSLEAVKDFCTRAIWIHQGEIRQDGNPKIVTEQYQIFMAQQDAINKIKTFESDLTDNTNVLPAYLQFPPIKNLQWFDLSKYQSAGTGEAFIRFASLVDKSTNQNISFLRGGETLQIKLIIETSKKFENPGIQLKLNGQFGATVLVIYSYFYTKELEFQINQPTLVSMDFTIPELSNGYYSFSLMALDNVNETIQHIHQVYDALMLEAVNPDIKYNVAAQCAVKEAHIQTSPILH